MTIPVAKPAEAVASAVKVGQLVHLVKNNQLVTALVLFVLWQFGAFATVSNTVGGCI